MTARIIAFLISGIAAEAQAVTLINNVKIEPAGVSQPGSYTIDYHGFQEALFTPVSSSTYLFSYMGIAEGFAFYNVNFGDLISPSFTEQTAPLLSNFNGGPFSANFVIAVNEDRYLGYYANGINYYGWVHIRNTPAGLIALESATSVGNGILVGSFTEIPEPSVSALGIPALASLTRRKRVRRPAFTPFPLIGTA